MDFETKVFDGVEVRRSNDYPMFWVSEDGRVVGEKMVWIKGGCDVYKAVQYPAYIDMTKPVKRWLRYKSVRVHRLVAEIWVLNENPKLYNQVDHIDGVKFNNHAKNLRWVSVNQNNMNNKANREGRRNTRFTGIWLERSGKWRAEIRLYTKRRYLGTYITEEEAAKAYDNALISAGLPPVNFPT